MNDGWRSARVQLKVRAPSSKKESEEANIRRTYNRMIKNAQVPITQDNKEFLSPEYLDYQKRTLITEIKRLKEEIKPLNKKYAEMLQQKEQMFPEAENDNSGYTTEFVAKISEEQKRHAQLESDLAKTRRFFSEATKLRLQYESKQYMDEINAFKHYVEINLHNIENKQKQISSITESQLAETIREQDHKIHELSDELSHLHQMERELKERTYEFLDNAASSNDNQKIEMLKKKLADLQVKKMRVNAEFKKMQSFAQMEADSLMSRIDLKQKMKQEQNYSKNWKKKLNIKEIVVTEEYMQEVSELPPLYNQK